MRELGACIRHPEEPALFRCRQCDDPACVRCRADGERDLCVVCGQYRLDSADRQARVAAGEEPDPRPRGIRWARYVVALLVLLNVGLGAYLALAARRDDSVARGMAAMRTVAGLLDESRDSSGRYPASLTTLLPQLPDDVARMVREDLIRYETDPARSEYRLSYVLRPRAPSARR
jgi:hypothetical protein